MTGYYGYLTGWLGDKNFSGLVYCLFGLLILSFARNKIEVILAIVVFLLCCGLLVLVPRLLPMWRV